MRINIKEATIYGTIKKLIALSRLLILPTDKCEHDKLKLPSLASFILSIPKLLD